MTLLRKLGARLRDLPRPLVALLIVSAILSTAWAMVVAPLQGPDERAHATYVQYLAETGNLPSPVEGSSPDSTELNDAIDHLRLLPLVGVLYARPAFDELQVKAWERRDAQLPDAARQDGRGPNPLAANPPLYYAYEAAAYHAGGSGLFGRLTAMRMASVLLHLIAVVAMWALAGQLFASRWLQTLATGMFALHPMTTFVSSTINADSLLTTAWVVLALLCVRLVRHGPSTANVLSASVAVAASLMSHGRGVAALPAFLVVLTITLYVHRPRLRAALPRVAGGLAIVGATLAVYRLAFISSGTGGALYGGQATQFSSGSFSPVDLLAWTWDFYFDNLVSLGTRPGPDYGYRQMFVERFLGGAFGSLEVTFEQRVYDDLYIVAGIGLVGLLLAIVVRRRALLAQWPIVVTLVSLTGATLALLHYTSFRSLAGGSVDPLITGRYLLPLTMLFALAVAFTVSALPRRLGAGAGAVLLSAATLLHLTGIGLTALRFYS